MLRLCGLELGYHEQQKLKLRIARLTSLLDGLSNGLLSRPKKKGKVGIRAR